MIRPVFGFFDMATACKTVSNSNMWTTWMPTVQNIMETTQSTSS